MKTTIIITVGTSILMNLKRDHQDLYQMVENERYADAARKIAGHDIPTVKKMSAELNSTISMIESGMIETLRCILITSDTDGGRKSARLLEKIFSSENTSYGFENVNSVDVAGLSDSRFEVFRKTGLTNLVSVICSLIRQYQGGVAINNTGGYKAEIAFAGIIGQAFAVPVYYQFEDFSNIIELPPLPVSVDVLLWKDNLEMFMELKEKNEVRLADEWNTGDERLSQVIETMDIDGETWLALTPAGHLFVQACEYTMSQRGLVNTKPLQEDQTPPEDKQVTLSGDHHGNDQLADFGRKLCKSRYVKRIISSMPYNPKAHDPVKRIDKIGSGWYVDFVMTGTDAGYTLRAEITAENYDEAKTMAALIISEITG